jgi:hypothetical protein
MSSYKPIPNTKREFMNKLVNPYPEAALGNPNQVYSESAKPGTPTFNRAYEISQKGDVDANVAVGLGDMDDAIQWQFDNVLKLSVTQNNQKRFVPVIYGSPERWKSIQADGYFRDKDNKIQVPLIIYRREGIEPIRNIGNKIDGNIAKNLMLVKRSYTKNDVYSNFKLLNNRIPEKAYTVVPIPDYVNVSYQCLMYTYFVEQMNTLVEAVNFSSYSYWGDPSKYMFRTAIDNFTNNVVIEAGDDRIVKSEFKITLNGYIIPDSLNREMAAANRSFGPSQIAFGVEMAESTGEYKLELPKK